MARINNLTPAEHALVSDAVAQAERSTSGEIVTIVAQRSDSYHDAGLHWAIAASFVFLSLVAAFPAFFDDALLAMLGGWESDLPVALDLTFLLGAMIAVFLIVRYALAYMPLRIALTPKATKARRVRRRAIMLFQVGTERRTIGRTGVLIYLSMDEHRAEIVADDAINAKVPAETWGDAMIALIEQARAGNPGAGMAEAVRQVGIVLAEHFPPSADNPNEMCDRLIEL